MTRDPLTRVRSGDPLEISAEAWNTVLEAARWVRERRQDRGGTAEGMARPTAIIKVKNNSGGDRARFEVLGVGAILYSPTDNADEFYNHPAVNGAAPAAGALGRFAVLLEPIGQSGIGWGLLSGITPVKVQVTAGTAAFNFATAVAGTTDSLALAETGAAEVLWREAGTSGTLWALVRVGPAGPAAAGGGTGDFTVWGYADGFTGVVQVGPVATDLTFDVGQGFLVEEVNNEAGQPLAAVVRGVGANQNYKGMVDTVAQTWKGKKEIRDNAVISQLVVSDSLTGGGGGSIGYGTSSRCGGAFGGVLGSVWHTGLVTISNDGSGNDVAATLGAKVGPGGQAEATFVLVTKDPIGVDAGGGRYGFYSDAGGLVLGGDAATGGLTFRGGLYTGGTVAPPAAVDGGTW